jgi:quinol monooxygenase YgiN
LEKVDIQATIAENKLLEFNQSKQAFLESLQQADGYIAYTEKPGCQYGLSIEWESRKQLDSFLNSELFQFFNGAIITLGHLKSVTVKSVKDKTNTT